MKVRNTPYKRFPNSEANDYTVDPEGFLVDALLIHGYDLGMSDPTRLFLGVLAGAQVEEQPDGNKESDGNQEQNQSWVHGHLLQTH